METKLDKEITEQEMTSIDNSRDQTDIIEPEPEKYNLLIQTDSSYRK